MMANTTRVGALVAGQSDEQPMPLSGKLGAVRAMCSGSGRGCTEFAETLLRLCEIMTQLADLEGSIEHATQPGNDEKQAARKWREISASTMKFAQASLCEQQLSLIVKLQALSTRGASIVKDPEHAGQELVACAVGKAAANMGPSLPGLVRPPPGFAALPAPPPGLPPPERSWNKPAAEFTLQSSERCASFDTSIGDSVSEGVGEWPTPSLSSESMSMRFNLSAYDDSVSA